MNFTLKTVAKYEHLFNKPASGPMFVRPKAVFLVMCDPSMNEL